MIVVTTTKIFGLHTYTDGVNEWTRRRQCDNVVSQDAKTYSEGCGDAQLWSTRDFRIELEMAETN